MKSISRSSLKYLFMSLILLGSLIQFLFLHRHLVLENPKDQAADDHKTDFAPNKELTFQHQTSTSVVKLKAKDPTRKPPQQSQLGKFCLVHVGKSGGGTLSCRFGAWLAKKCPNSGGARNVLQRYVLGKLHKARDWGCLRREKHPSVWLFTIRSPIDRINSWFQYEHPNHELINEVLGNRPLLYDECFHSIEELSLRGLANAWKYSKDASRNQLKGDNETQRIHDQKCAKRAWDAVTGNVAYQYHNFYNYGYYKRYIDYVMTGYNYSILVLRSEHLKEDWAGLEKLYSVDERNDRHTSENDYFDIVRNHSSNRTIHKDAYPELCRALCEEIKVYKSLLSAAVNLSPEQRQESLDELQKQCGPVRDDDCKVPEIVTVHDDAKLEIIPSFPMTGTK